MPVIGFLSAFLYYILENKGIKVVLNGSNDILINADYFIRSNIKIEFFQMR